MSAPPAFNPAYAASSIPDTPPPPYQAVDPQYSGPQAPVVSYPLPAEPIAFHPAPQGQPPQSQPQYAQPVQQPLQPAHQPAAFASWPPSNTAPPPPPPVIEVRLPPFGVDVKDPRHTHVLRHKASIYNGEYECNVCRMGRAGGVFHCAICNWDMCQTCWAGIMQQVQPQTQQQQQQQPMPIAPHKDARHPHPLVWKSVYVNQPGQSFRCDGCGQPGRGQAWHCDRCSFDLHAQCLRPVPF